MKLLYIGNKHYKTGNVKSVLETLEELFIEFIDIKTCSNKKNKFIRLLDMLYYFFRYGLFCDKIMIDVYSTLAITYTYIFSILSIIFNKKYILFLHGGNLPARYKSSPKMVYFIFSHAEKIISPSSYLQSFFKDKGFSVTIIPNIINIEKYPFHHRKIIKPKLLALRGFSSIYNPMMTLEAIKLLKPEFPDIELLMLGKTGGKEFHEIKTFITVNDLENNIFIKDKMPLEKWIEISRNYDIMVSNPIIDNAPVSLIEGMALGMCIISTNVGGLPHLVDENNCILIENNNIYELSENIKKLITDSSLGSKLSLAGRTKSNEFSWPSVKSLWKKVLN